jgi:hypothetical protein
MIEFTYAKETYDINFMEYFSILFIMYVKKGKMCRFKILFFQYKSQFLKIKENLFFAERKIPFEFKKEKFNHARKFPRPAKSFS